MIVWVQWAPGGTGSGRWSEQHAVAGATPSQVLSDWRVREVHALCGMALPKASTSTAGLDRDKTELVCAECVDLAPNPE